jgi:serine/threonine protein kinase
MIVTAVAKSTTARSIQPGVGVDVEQATRWLRQACRGVARVHDAALLHNDIKPENLFISNDQDVLVGDLGIACLRDATGAGHFGGTAETMAPEVAVVGVTMSPAAWPNRRPTTVLSDVYALGASLYWLLAGIPPFHVPGDNVATMRAVVAGPPARIRDVAPHVPQALAERVERAMDRTAASRYQSPADLDAALGNMPAPEAAMEPRRCTRWPRRLLYRHGPRLRPLCLLRPNRDADTAPYRDPPRRKRPEGQPLATGSDESADSTRAPHRLP